jgi:hypothetical protein
LRQRNKYGAYSDYQDENGNRQGGIHAMLSNIVRSWNQISTSRKILRVVLVGLIIFVAWAASPLFYNRMVNEAFPAPAAMPTAMAGVAAPQAVAEVPAAMPTAMADVVAPQAMAEVPAAMPTAMAKPADDVMMVDPAVPAAVAGAVAPAAMADEPAATTMPAGPVALQRGSFVDGSLPGHHAAGTATVFRLEDGSQIVRLENFEATNGPDLFVTFHTGANPEQDRGEYFQIAALKGNIGDQNYELPADFDLGQYKSVVIWCRTFNVVFGYATLAPAA